MLFGKIPLPIWIQKEEDHAFVFEDTVLSETELRAAVYAEAWLSVLDGELVYSEESYAFDGVTATLILRYRIIEDVAKTLPLFETP